MKHVRVRATYPGPSSCRIGSELPESLTVIVADRFTGPKKERVVALGPESGPTGFGNGVILIHRFYLDARVCPVLAHVDV